MISAREKGVFLEVVDLSHSDCSFRAVASAENAVKMAATTKTEAISGFFSVLKHHLLGSEYGVDSESCDTSTS